MKKAQCQHCNKKYTRKTHNQKYCSIPCRERHSSAAQRAKAGTKGKKHATCRVCGKTKPRAEMQTVPYMRKGSPRRRIMRYCIACKGLLKCTRCKEIKNEKHFPLYPGGKVTSDGRRLRRALCKSCTKTDRKTKRRATKRAKDRARKPWTATERRLRDRLAQRGPGTDIEACRRIIAKSNSRCAYCWRTLDLQDPRDWQAEHATPLKRGGTNVEDNIVLSCPNCNHHKGNATYHELLLWCHTIVKNHKTELCGLLGVVPPPPGNPLL